MVKIIDSPAERAEFVIKAVFQWQELRLITQMPFAADRGRIAAGGQSSNKNVLFSRQSKLTLACQTNCVVIPANSGQADRAFQAAYPLLVTASHQGRPRRRALRPVSVVTRQPQSLPGECVNIGRPDIRAAVAGQIPVAHVISED